MKREDAVPRSVASGTIAAGAYAGDGATRPPGDQLAAGTRRADPLRGGRWIDISMPMQDGLRSNHSRPGEEVQLSFDVDPAQSGWKTVRRINTRLHVGTHVDAPEHLILAGRRLDDFPIQHYVGTAIVADLNHKVPRGVISGADLEQAVGSDLLPGQILILRTGWNSRYADTDFFTDSPYLDLDAADWIIRRRAKLVVVDFLTDPVDPALQTAGVDAFKIAVLKHDILVMTNADNLDQITQREVLLFGFPLSIVPSEAAPTRAVVWEPSDAEEVERA